MSPPFCLPFLDFVHVVFDMRDIREDHQLFQLHGACCFEHLDQTWSGINRQMKRSAWQATRGRNIIADKWVGAFNLRSHSNPDSPALKQTNKKYPKYLFYPYPTRSLPTDKATFKVACPQRNKAGYTATSCGRVGRGENARFQTFQRDHYRPTVRGTKPLKELRVRN